MFRRLLALAVMLAASCAETPRTDETGGAIDPAGEPEPAVAAARYATTLAFVPYEDGEPFLASFVHDADPDGLARSYTVWRAGSEEWATVLRVRDTLPVPRAAWRVLPADSLRIRVGGAARLLGLRVRAGDRGFEMVGGEEISDWAGATGQRQSLALAALVHEPIRPGILLSRRAARALSAPGSNQIERTFVVADSSGAVIVLEPYEAGGGSARSWLHGVVETWPEIEFAVLPDSTRTAEDTVSRGATDPLPAAWRFMITDVGVGGELIREPPTLEVGPGGGHRAFRVMARLTIDGDLRTFRGLGIEVPLP